MDSGERSWRTLKLINLARASYGAFELERLLRGQPLSASFCPIGRSLRAGVEDWLFVAVGTKYLRVWAPGKDPVSVGKNILTAWGMSQDRLKQPGGRSGFVMLPLPAELREFVDEFDHGLLPDYQGYADPQEVRGLRELARGMPIPGRYRNLNLARSGGAQPFEMSTNILIETAYITGFGV